MVGPQPRRVLRNLIVHFKNPPAGIPKSGNYDIIAAGSDLIFVKRGFLGFESGVPLDFSVDELVNKDPKNFALPLGDLKSVQIKKGIPMTTESKIVFEQYGSRLVLEINGSSVDSSRLKDAQDFLSGLSIGRIEGAVSIGDVRKIPWGVRFAGSFAFLHGAITLIVGGILIAVGGSPAIIGVALALYGLFLLIVSVGLFRGRKWAWVLGLIVSGLGTLDILVAIVDADPRAIRSSFLSIVTLFSLLIPQSVQFFKTPLPSQK